MSSAPCEIKLIPIWIQIGICAKLNKWARSDIKKLLYHVYYNTNRCTHIPEICVCVDQIWSTQAQIFYGYK